ncbi:hypothetical protein O3M35_002330 [Rhynocoris fuscipes]|uniref:Uncharacterized protein n=1 Tax=Rhynocoris fuscipes TaxID=488301 RepID=A0AAW1CL50_9HEMI
MLHPLTKILLNENFISIVNQHSVLRNILKSTKRSFANDKSCRPSIEVDECPCEDKIKKKREKEKRIKPRQCPGQCGRWEPQCDIYMQEDQPYKPPKFESFGDKCCPPKHLPCTQPCDPCPGEVDHSKDSWNIHRPTNSPKSKKGKKKSNKQ